MLKHIDEPWHNLYLSLPTDRHNPPRESHELVLLHGQVRSHDLEADDSTSHPLHGTERALARRNMLRDFDGGFILHADILGAEFTQVTRVAPFLGQDYCLLG